MSSKRCVDEFRAAAAVKQVTGQGYSMVEVLRKGYRLDVMPFRGWQRAIPRALLLGLACSTSLCAHGSETTNSAWSLTGTGNVDARIATNTYPLSNLGVTANFPVGGAPGFATPPVFQAQPSSMSSGGIPPYPYRAVDNTGTYQPFGGAGASFPTTNGALGINTSIGLGLCTRSSPTATETPCGRLAVSFTQPVRNPSFHFVQMGGGGTTVINAAFDPVAPPLGATPAWAPVAFNNPAAFSMNMLVTAARAGANSTAGGNCNGTVADPDGTSSSVCGSASLIGTNSAFNFNVVHQFWGANGVVTGGDGFRIQITVDNDFGDAPSSYDAGAATFHVLSDLALGATTAITAEYRDSIITATTASPNAGVSASGDSDNAFIALASVNGSATSYAVTVPVSGISKAAQLCGYIDFNRDSDFGDVGEQACANAAAAATSAVLTWTLPAGTAYVAGNSYARFRLGYTAAQVQSPSGAADSGEVEDYPIVLLPRVRLNKTLAPTGDTGAFNLSISPTLLPAGTATAANQGNGGSTGLATVNLNTAVTFSETAGTATALANYASSVTCVNRAGTTVLASTAGTSATFTTMSSASTGANATPATAANSDNTEVTCTLTNARLPTVTVTKVSNNGVGTFAFAGTNGFANQNITTVTAGTGVAGVTQTLTAASTATTISESAPPVGFTLVSIACTGLGAGGTATPTVNGISGGNVLLDAAATAAGSTIACTFTNNRLSQQLNLTKTWVNGGTGHSVGATTSGATNNASLASTAPGPTAGTAVAVFAGESITLPVETFGGGAAAAMSTTTVACTGGTVLAASAPPQTVTVTNNATATTCTYINTRVGKTLTLRKQWSGATIGDDATLTVSRGGTAIDTLASDAGTAGELDSDATPTQVFAGEILILAETLAGTNTGLYDTTLACSGGGSVSASTLTVDNTATDIVCTYVNARQQADVLITKTNGTTSVIAGTQTTYTVVASNAGPAAAGGAIVQDTPTSGLSGCAVTACTPSGGATCPTTPGNILVLGGAAIPILPTSGSVTFTVTCNVN